MPRQRRRPNATIASAARVSSRRTRNFPQMDPASWQEETWEKLDTVGELEFYREYVSNALSMVTLEVIREVRDPRTGAVSEELQTSGDPYAVLQTLFDGDNGQPEMMASLASQLSFPGDCWLVGIPEPDLEDPDAPDQWRVLDKSELKDSGGRWVIDRGDGMPEEYSKGSPGDLATGDQGEDAELLVIRIWNPHPKRYAEATSSVRSALPILRELVGLTKRIAADIDSRLIGNGWLLVPSEATFQAPPTASGEEDDGDGLIGDMIDVAAEAIRDQSSAAARVPGIIKMPGETIQKVKHLTISTALDDKAIELRAELLKRLANSLNIPAEVLLGLADVNHWTGWLLDENTIKMHIEPLVKVICGALTTRYLWPSLQGDAETLDPALRAYRIRGNTSALRQRPDRSQDAQLAHDRLVITDAAFAREAGGFTGEDLLKPGSDEYVRRLAQRAAASAGPDAGSAALDMLGVDVPPPAPTAVQVPTPPPPAIEAPKPPTGPPNGGDADPPTPSAPPAAAQVRDEAAWEAALVLGTEAVVQRAIERGWNRAGKRGKSRRPVEAARLDLCLDGAWENVPRIAALCQVDETRLREALDHYTRAVLRTGEEHSPTAFTRLLRERVLAGG